MMKTIAIAAIGALLCTSSVSFAQVGSGNVTPSAAREKGTASGETEGKSTTSGPPSRGAGTGENKPTATGGQSGGATDQQ